MALYHLVGSHFNFGSVFIVEYPLPVWYLDSL
jgi:hypothetical protein